MNLALHSTWMVIQFMLVFCSCRSFPIGEKTAFKEGDSKTHPGHGIFVASVSGDSISSFFALCFALLFVHITIPAPQEIFCRICCLVIVTFMEISLNFKRTKHLSLVTGFQLMNSSEKVD